MSYRTAWDWFRTGILPVPVRQLPTGTILVDVPEPGEDEDRVAIYARVSSSDQQPDLDGQVVASGPGAGRCLSEILEEMAALMAHVEHRLYVERYIHKRPLADCKQDFIKRYGITARQFNAVAMVLDGKVEGALGAMRNHLASLEARAVSVRNWIEKKERKVAALTKQIADETSCVHAAGRRRRADGAKLAELVAERKRLRFQLHHKLRYLADLEHQRDRVAADLEACNPRLCLGGRKRFRAQFDLEANGHRSHEAWLADWQQARASQVFLVGSKDETGGNQTLTFMPNGTLRLRVPKALATEWGRWVFLPMPTFPYGDAEIAVALARGDGISWRFIYKKRGWRLQAIVDVEPAPIITIPEAGAIGADLNTDHLASCELDHFGNPLPATARSLPLSLYKRSHAQIEAALGNAVARLVTVAKATSKPVVVERLDFQAKRARLREIGGHAYARMLSGFAYAKFLEMLRSRCEREGVEIIVVNPAWTSLIGLVKFAHGYGLSSHQAAAVAIGRRGMGPRRKICKHKDRSSCDCAPVPQGLAEHLATKARTTRPLPARTRGRHVWSDWRRSNKKLREEFSLGCCPSEGGGGGTRARPVGHRSAVGKHGSDRDRAQYRVVAVPGCDSLVEVGNAVRPATVEEISTG